MRSFMSYREKARWGSLKIDFEKAYDKVNWYFYNKLY
jgi:hypothetical protein